MNIYVGNLNFGMTEDDVRTLFAPHGEVHSVKMIVDRQTGRPRGFAFVEMEQSNAQAAIEALNGVDVNGRNIQVNEAKERKPQSGGMSGQRPNNGFRRSYR